jgi:predicted dehydrogenase
MEVAYAWAKTDKPGGKPNRACCAETGVALLGSAREVVEKSDCLIVMAPDHSELHEELCGLPMASGKPVYVDKTFAPDRAAARRIIQMARAGDTPFFSSSALRFAKEYADLPREGIEAIASRGPGMFETYGIHQIEPIVSLMGPEIGKIMYVGTESTPAFVLRFRDGRCATVAQLGWACDFSLAVNYRGDRAVVKQGASDFYQRFIAELVGFFGDGVPRVRAEETLQVITVLEYGKRAAARPDTWIALPE